MLIYELKIKVIIIRLKECLLYLILRNAKNPINNPREALIIMNNLLLPSIDLISNANKKINIAKKNSE